MSTASLYVFCCSNELINWIKSLCLKEELAMINFCDTCEFGTIFDSANSFDIQSDTYRVFLFPKSSMPHKRLKMNEIKAREWGWVDIRPGGTKEDDIGKILYLTEIHGEDFQIESIHPAKYVRKLKRRIKQYLTSGVIGRNIVTGGESLYQDVNYTACVYELYKAGVTWKQHGNNRVIFEPQ